MVENIIQDLGGGLVLRQATVADTEALVEFNARIHGNSETGEPNEHVGEWVRDLAAKPHPTFAVADFTIVEDTTTGKIVSSLNLINQTWSYAGVEFGVGRPELVGTEPEYRHRGLIRAQFDLVHQWSAERGHKVQAITGIPYYYRQFGYEMTVALGGGRIGYLPHMPKLKEGQQEAFVIRPASYADIPFIINEVYPQVQKRNLISCVRAENWWRYEIAGRSEKNINRSMVVVIERAEGGEPVGLILHGSTVWGPNINMWCYELKPGVSWFDVTPAVIRYMVATGKEYAAKKDDIELAGYNFNMGPEHPVYQVYPEQMPRLYDPYSWYLRVADIPDFLTLISPVLEQRLAQSAMVGHTGEFKLGFYRSGVKLVFEKGKIKSVEGYKPVSGQDGDVLFPDLTFLRVLFGSESFAEVERKFTDCIADNDLGRALTPILFPKQNSNIWAIA